MRFIVLMVLAIVSSGAAAQISSGTAFAVAPGLLVTNQHVVDGCAIVYVFTADGRRIGVVTSEDAQIDLALLRVTGLKGVTARLRNPRNIRLGESVMVFGFPLTGSLSSGGNFTSGLVSALRGLRDAAGEIQITAPVQPGNSGGPLLDASGLVVGVVQSKLDALRSAIVTGDIPQNINFAISLDVLAGFLAKNRVSFRDGVTSAPLEAARVAELAQSFTHRIECIGTPQQTAAPSTSPRAAPPGSAPPQLPSCPGLYTGSTWTNCIGTYEIGNATYVGQWENGMQHGQGIYTWYGGRKYVGEFKFNKPDGKGIEYQPDGSILQSGIWKNGVFIGGR